MNQSRYYLAAIAAFAIWGFFSLVLRPIHQYPSLDILFYRVFFCGALMLIISLSGRRSVLNESRIIFNKLPKDEKKKVLLTNLAAGIFLTCNWFFFIYVMNHISVKATSLAYLVCPILTTLLANILLKERLERAQWLAVALSASGCILLSLSSLSDLLYSLIIALSYALYLVVQRRNQRFDAFLTLSVQILISAVLLLPFYPHFSTAVPSNLSFFIYILIIAVLFTIVPLLLNLYALRGINSSTVGMLLYINPIIAFVLAV